MRPRPSRNLGQSLRELRLSRDLKQKEIVGRTGETINERVLRGYESGDERPSRDRLLKLLIKSFEIKSSGEINDYLQLASYAVLTDREIQQFSLAPAEQSDGNVQRGVHGAIYQTPEAISARLTELVTTSPKQHILYVAIGEGDFVKAWLSRLMQTSTGLRSPAISSLVFLGLSAQHARRLEAKGRLKPGFAKTMQNNIESVIADTGLPFEHRVWEREPEFHGYLYNDVALNGSWAVDKLGRIHVLTPVMELRLNEDPVRFRSMLRTFQSAAASGASGARNS